MTPEEALAAHNAEVEAERRGAAFGEQFKAMMAAHREREEKRTAWSRLETDIVNEFDTMNSRLAAMEGYTRWMLDEYNLLGRPVNLLDNPGFCSAILVPDQPFEWRPHVVPRTVDTVTPLVAVQLADGTIRTEECEPGKIDGNGLPIPKRDPKLKGRFDSMLKMLAEARKAFEEAGYF